MRPLSEGNTVKLVGNPGAESERQRGIEPNLLGSPLGSEHFECRRGGIERAHHRARCEAAQGDASRCGEI